MCFVWYLTLVYFRYAAALKVLDEMETLLASQNSIECGSGADSGKSSALFADHHRIAEESVDLAFQVSQTYLLPGSDVKEASNSALTVEKWKALVEVQRSSTVFKQRRMN